MRKAILFLFFLLVITMCAGFYFRYSENTAMGDKFIGLSLIAGIVVLMPMFLYHRWKGRNVKDYMLDEDNIKKMRDFSEGKKSKNDQ